MKGYGCALAAALSLVVPATASADSGSITNVRDIGGGRLEATFSATGTYCTPDVNYCGWFPFATNVPLGEACDGRNRSGRAIWVGENREFSSTQTATVNVALVFGPPSKLCLFTYHPEERYETVAEYVYTPPPPTPPPPTGTTGGDRDCSEFRYQEDAQVFLLPGDPHRLDADRNGIACEGLPRRGSPTGTPSGTTGTPSGAFVEPLPVSLRIGEAQRTIRTALRRRFGSRFTRGFAYRRSCSRLSLSRVRCRVSWRRTSARYSGTVTVWAVSDSRPRYSVRVRRR